MPSLATVEIDALFSMFTGEPGVRKSSAALSYPTPQYWVSTDQKMEALKRPANAFGIRHSDVEYDNYTDWDGPRQKLESFKVNCKYRTVIVDSATSIGDCINRQTRKSKKSSGQGGKMIGNIQVDGLEEYNAEAAAFSELIAILKDIHQYHHLNVIVIAHVVGQRKDDPNNKLTHHARVIITGGDKISGKVASYMTEVYHFNVKPAIQADKEGDYACLTVHTGNDYARTALPLPQEIVFNNDPLYSKWVKPAIERLKKETPIVNSIPSTSTGPSLTVK